MKVQRASFRIFRAHRRTSKKLSNGVAARYQMLADLKNSAIKDDKNTTNINDEHFSINPISLLESSMKGVGQVVFLNSPRSGLLILLSLGLADPFLATTSMIGSISSGLAATVMQLDKQTLQSGLFSYNGALVGCATAVFVAPQLPASIITCLGMTSVGAVASTVTYSSIAAATGGKMPQWTIAFNMVTLTYLLHLMPLKTSTSVDDVSSGMCARDLVATATVGFEGTDLLTAPLVGLSQIFVVDSALTGAGILGAIAIYSPALSAHALAGSAIGSSMGYFAFGVPWTDITSGLWGYNAALTSLGVAVFTKPGISSTAISLGGAAATSAVFAAVQPLFADLVHVPCLTVPFCLTMPLCYALAYPEFGIPSLQHAAIPHSPEQNGD